MLKSIEALRKFVDTLDEVLPGIGERPSRRETVIDAAPEMADRLVTNAVRLHGSLGTGLARRRWAVRGG